MSDVTPWEQEMGSCHALCMSSDGSLRTADQRQLGRVAGY
jgi:hypothetical protein